MPGTTVILPASGTVLPFEDVDQGFHSLVTHGVGILGNGALQDVVAAEDHAGELVGAIIAEDEDLASHPGLLDGHGCADGAAFVAGKDDLDFGVGGQHVGGGGQGSVLSVGALVGNFGVRHAGGLQAGVETAPASLGLVGQLVIEVDAGDVDVRP